MKNLQFFFIGWLLLVFNWRYIDLNISTSEKAHTYHAIYLSVCEIDYLNSSLQIRMKVFTDDLEDAIRNQTGEIIKIEGHLAERVIHNKINNYLLSKFSISTNGKPLNLVYLKSEIENDALWVYFQSKQVKPFTYCTISNTTFIELFESQINVISMHYQSEKYFFRLDKQKTENRFVFE
ncbi:MAG: DUF6702 family protein [Bacteroidota bacterium]